MKHFTAKETYKDNPYISKWVDLFAENSEFSEFATTEEVDDFEAFSESTAYSSGDIVRYDGKLYKFTANKSAGAWDATKVSGTNVLTIASSLGGVVSTTWSALKALRDGGNLKAGSFYRITDYACTTSQANTQSADHPFDIIVFALDASHLSEKAFADYHSGDTYFANAKLDAWKIWYSLDNDLARFSWAISTGKGVIYRMIDEYSNDCPYDFKNIMFYRKWNSTKFLWSDIVSSSTYGAVPCYTFSSAGSSSTTSFTDYSLSGSNNIHSNSLKEYTISNRLKLNNSCFFGNSCFSNTLGNDCNSNTFGSQCNSNILGNNCYSNTFYNSSSNNILNNNCYSNTIVGSNNNLDSSCYSNTIKSDLCKLGLGCYSNSVDSESLSNSFDNRCHGNQIGASSYGNSFGPECANNIIGYQSSKNLFGTGCESNNLGDDVTANQFDNYCFNNILGNKCYYNKFGVNCRRNSMGANNCGNVFVHTVQDCKLASSANGATLGEYFYYNTFEPAVMWVIIYNTQTASSNNRCRYAHIKSGITGTSGSPRTVQLTRGLTYTTEVGNNSSGVTKTYCVEDLIS